MAVVVRELTARDRYELARLMREVAGLAVDDRSPHAASFLTDPSTFAFGAYLDDVAVGWAWGHTQRRPDGRVATYVHEIDVVESARREGVASMLMRGVIARARRAGHQRVWLVTQVDNAAANELYDSLGARRSGGAGETVWTWEL